MLKYICRNVSFLPGRRNWAPRCQVWRSWSTEHDRLHSRSTVINLVANERGAWSLVNSSGSVLWLAWIYRRSCAKMVEILRAWHPLLHTSNVAPITYHFTLRTSARQPVSPSARRPVGPSLTIPHTSHSLPHTSSVGPSQQTIALVNMPFSPVPKARGRGRRWIWGPCKW